MPESELTFESVRQRWEESLSSLETLKQSLETLAAAEEQQSEMSKSISSASSKLQNMCEALAASTTELEATMSQLRSIAEASGKFLEGEELKAARSDVAMLREEVVSSLSSVQSRL